MKKLVLFLLVVMSLSACAMFDNEPPVINLINGEEIQVEYGSILDLSNHIEITDNYSQDIVVEYDGVPETNVLGTTEVSIKATDEKENESTSMIIVTIVDTQAPSIKFIGEPKLELNYSDTYNELGVEVKDNVDDNVELTINSDVANGEIGEYKVEYIAKDSSGNISTLVRQINIKDLTGPEITLNGESEVKLTLGKFYDDSGAIAIDEIDNECELTVTEAINYMKAGNYEISYSSKDKSGNETVVKRSIVIESLPLKTVKNIDAKLQSLAIIKDNDEPELWAEAVIEVTNNRTSDFNDEPVFWFNNSNGDQMNFDLYTMGELGNIEAGATEIISYRFGCDESIDMEMFYDIQQVEFQFFPDTTIGSFPKKYNYSLKDLYNKSSIRD